jgi:hypothetical protein
MKRGTLNLLGSLLFMILVLGGYFYIWRSASLNAPPAVSSESYTPVDVTAIKGQADTLIKTRVNNAGIPIPDPIEKLGKSNPFNSPE